MIESNRLCTLSLNDTVKGCMVRSIQNSKRAVPLEILLVGQDGNPFLGVSDNLRRWKERFAARIRYQQLGHALLSNSTTDERLNNVSQPA